MRSLLEIIIVTGMVLGMPAQVHGGNKAVDTSCANWLQNRDGRFFDGYRTGYAQGVISALDASSLPPKRDSSIKNVGELITALDAVCTGTPEKRLIDVAMHLMGYR